MTDTILTHLKDRGHVWVLGLSVLTLALYLGRALSSNQTAQLTANIVLILVAAGTVYGGTVALTVLALLKKENCGELAEFRNSLILGLLVGVALSAMKLLSLFGLFDII